MGNKTERIHSLDALRAIMMLLGIILHAAITYTTESQGRAWPLKDPNSTDPNMDILIEYIHSFRMPIFFIVAGFFAALLYYERSPRKMLKNRFKRILLPFVVFVFLLWPTLGGSFLYTFKAFTGGPPPQAPSEGFSLMMLVPISTFHLWFLYYLIMISTIGFILAKLVGLVPKLGQWISTVFNIIINNALLKILLGITMLFTLLSIIEEQWIPTSAKWIVNWKVLLFYTMMYLTGWILFKSKQYLHTFIQYDWLLVFGGILAMFVSSIEYNYIWLGRLFSAMSICLSVFGITGLFIRYCSKHSAQMRYISDASYWVYLIHLPLTIFIPGLLADLAIPAVLKFMIVVIITTIITFVTYHYWVRATFIGKFLNGRKYPRKPVARVKALG
ncbi:MAG: acyltransferase family protein [Saprospiraceae bacterium]|nr:acyltransferase family protein [Saprospiraceae bacterium]